MCGKTSMFVMAGVIKLDEELHWLLCKPCFVLGLLFVVNIASKVDCGCSLQNGNGSAPRFTEGPQNKLHVSYLGFQNMKCPVANYCSIQWYMQSNKIKVGDFILKQNQSDFELDFGDPYPWDLDQDTDITLENDNKTLRFQSAGKAARGYYTCVVSNGEYKIARTTRVQVNDVSWYGDPLTIKNDHCFNQTAALGHNVTLQCTFYIGELIQVNWWRPNTTLPEDQWGSCGSDSWLIDFEFEKLAGGTTYVEQTTTAKVDSPAITGKLQVFTVSKEAYGLYCIIANNYGKWSSVVLELSPPEEKRELASSIGPALIILASLFIIFMLSSLIWKAVALDVKLWYHIHYSVAKKQDERLYDAYVSYLWTDEDRLFVLNVLMPYFEKHGYKLFIPEIHTVPSNVFLEELRKAMESSRRCILLITRNYLNSEYGKFEVELAADVMSSKMSECIIPVLLGVSPCHDTSPLSGSSSSLSSQSSTRQLFSRPSSVPSFSLSSDNYPSTSQPSQETTLSFTASISNDLSTASSQHTSSNHVQINFNFCPLLRQLVKVLKPLKIKRKEPFKQCNYKRFLKRLHLRMPKLPSGSGHSHTVQEIMAVPHTHNNEELPDENWNQGGYNMVDFPNVYPVIHTGTAD